MRLLEQLQELPDNWGLVAVGANKRAYMKGWQNAPLTKEQAAAEIIHGSEVEFIRDGKTETRLVKAKAIGVLAGPLSGGLLFVDHDGISANAELERLGLPTRSLPKSVSFTSGRDGRYQIVYRIPPEYWPSLRSRRVFYTGQLDDEGKKEQVDLRWQGHYSVIIGHHPQTSGYRWFRGTSPSDRAVADAPLALIELLLDTPEPEPAPLLAPLAQAGASHPAGPLPLLDFITRDSRELIESGGTPGSWNDDHIRLALDLRGTETWILAQGHRPDLSAGQAFEIHITNARGKAPDFDDRKAWHRFHGADAHAPTPGTPFDKLLQRLAFHTRTARPLLPPSRATQQEAGAPERAPAPGPFSPQQPTTASTEPAGNGYFTCLGFDQDAFYYQPHRTGQVVRLSRSSHTGTNLVALAPLGYWEKEHPGNRNAPNWTAAASQLFWDQAQVGVYAPDRIRGRGAWWDRNQSVLHLGDRLVVDGNERPVTSRIPGSPYLYQRLSSLQGPAGVEPLSDTDAYLLAHIAERFHWEVPASGLLLAGWVTLAPICGALDWRPHAWLTAAAGSGKSAILDRYVTPLLGDMGLIVAGNTTEPGIRQALRADALPVVFDEAESNERTDQQRMQAILGLARVASSESKAHTLKGTPEGDTQRFVIRSMFLMSSIATSLKQGADRSRFAQLTLRSHSEIPKAERLAHWEALDRDLDRHISEEIGRRLQARTIGLIPTIRASIRVFTRVAAERFDSQRLGDQYGTLLAGAWSLQSSAIVSDEQARQLIDQNNWEPYSQATEIPDERRCIQRILQHQVRVEAEKTLTRSIGELVELALFRETDMHISAGLAESTLGRNGIKVDTGALLVSNNADAIANILRDTSWSNCWPTVLSRLPGATKAGSVYFRGAGTNSRAVRIPIDAVDTSDPP